MPFPRARHSQKNGPPKKRVHPDPVFDPVMMQVELRREGGDVPSPGRDAAVEELSRECRVNKVCDCLICAIGL